MTALAIFGWFVILAIGAWMSWCGGFFCWATNAFSGRPEGVALALLIFGIAVLALAWWTCPFQITVGLQ